MCGIFGMINGGAPDLDARTVQRVTNRLFRLSETRGKEASGLTWWPSIESEQLLVVKSPETAAALMRTPRYRALFTAAGPEGGTLRRGVLFGHTRLVTNGSQLTPANNQPVAVDGVVAVHNGIIVNVDDLWVRHPELRRQAEVDTEVLLALIARAVAGGRSPVQAVRDAFGEIQGTASCAILFPEWRTLVLATNHGSLYHTQGPAGRPLVFASEGHTLRRLLASRVGLDFSDTRIVHVRPNAGVAIDLAAFTVQPFGFAAADETLPVPSSRGAAPRVEALAIGAGVGLHSVYAIRKVTVPTAFERAAEQAREAAARLRRCTRCILPETVPFIDFDAEGVCNFCRFHQPVIPAGRAALDHAIAAYRRPGDAPDCVCSISGGRDSCYGLHYVVKELGMKPIAYTYDWGMVTDLARRNIARMCSQLGVEHILISANIPKKRANIRMNVEAWLHKPHLGMIPLFMAGDKQFVWYGNRVKRENDLQLDFFTFNLFEKTQFKEEFSGIPFWRPGADADKLGEELGVWRGIKLCGYYGSQFLTNAKYLNRSLLDTFYGFVTYYVLPRTFLALFRYIPWREDEVVNTLLREYDWELASDTRATWRIGDGTASFYNYIYYTLAGFTEHDTLRAGQVREGHLPRAEALALVTRDNVPRWDSFKWYCDVVGLDFERTVTRINAMPRVSGMALT